MDKNLVAINEIFYSLQGEGVLAGVPTVFVRFQGCNLLPNCCKWCDTVYAQGKRSKYELSITEVADECVKLNPRTYKAWVCITGGEPLFQEESLYRLVRQLHLYGLRTEVETNGTIGKPNWWSLVDSWVVDIKCPSSRVSSKGLVDEWFEIRECDQVKFVVADQKDLDFARKIINSKATSNPTVLVSPVMCTPSIGSPGFDLGCLGWDQTWLQEVAEFCKDLRIRMSIQQHKLIGLK